MLLTHLKDKHPDFLENPPSISDLNAFYKESKKRFDDDADFKQRSQDEALCCRAAMRRALTGWKSFCKVSEKMFTKVYARLGVKFPDGTCGESFYNSRIPAVIDELIAKGALPRSPKARSCAGQKTKALIPFMVRKSNGSYGYASTDITALKYRVGELKCNWLVYVVDSGQQLHLRQLFSAARKSWMGEAVSWQRRQSFAWTTLTLASSRARIRSASKRARVRRCASSIFSMKPRVAWLKS